MTGTPDTPRDRDPARGDGRSPHDLLDSIELSTICEALGKDIVAHGIDFTRAKWSTRDDIEFVPHQAHPTMLVALGEKIHRITVRPRFQLAALEIGAAADEQ